jgi:hypothetical protein
MRCRGILIRGIGDKLVVPAVSLGRASGGNV